jgi:uncharacterized protein YbjQ (UPF0145 family)
VTELIQFVLTVGGFFLFISLGFFFGRRAERRHFRDLRRREAAFQDVMTTQLKHFHAAAPGGKQPKLIVAETVIASDYMKSFLAKLRNIFGGEVRSFETLLERGRREVTVKLKEKAVAEGYNAICNVRLNTASIGGMSAKAAAMASILGWATAYDTTLAQSPAEGARPDLNHLA